MRRSPSATGWVSNSRSTFPVARGGTRGFRAKCVCGRRRRDTRATRRAGPRQPWSWDSGRTATRPGRHARTAAPAKAKATACRATGAAVVPLPSRMDRRSRDPQPSRYIPQRRTRQHALRLVPPMGGADRRPYPDRKTEEKRCMALSRSPSASAIDRRANPGRARVPVSADARIRCQPVNAAGDCAGQLPPTRASDA
jgi:hypothetical protein